MKPLILMLALLCMPPFAAAADLDPDDPEAHRRLARSLARSGDWTSALEHFEIVVALEPSEQAILDLAVAFRSLGRPDDSAAAYERLLVTKPTHALALHDLATISLEQGRAKTAIELYRKAIAGRPGYLSAHYFLGIALRRAERYEEAYGSFAKVLGLEPTDARELELFDESLYQMASLDMQMGATERARQMLVELLRANPDHAEAHLALGRILEGMGRVEEAQRALEAHRRLISGSSDR